MVVVVVELRLRSSMRWRAALVAKMAGRIGGEHLAKKEWRKWREEDDRANMAGREDMAGREGY
jgi:hypothetical protein